MAAKLTMTAGTVTRGVDRKYEIPYARVGIYDVEATYKDSMTIDKFITMYEDKNSTIIITNAWEQNGRKYHAKKAKLTEDISQGSVYTILITEGELERVYKNISSTVIESFYNVAKSTSNGRDNFDNISMKDY